MPELWCPIAIRLDGPASKTGYNGIQKTHAKVGVVLHTMEYESTPEWNDATTLRNALFSSREASWTFSICKFMNGAILFQHYPLDAVCWAQGYLGNLWLIGIETEGIAPGKFTEAQYELLVKLLRWLKEAQGWKKWDGIGERGFMLDLAPKDRSTWLYEHNAVPGAPATNCAVFTHQQVDSARLLADLKGGDTMTDADRAWVMQFSGGIKLIKGGPPTVYVVDHRGKRPFPGGPTEFLKVGFDWDNVIRLPDTVIGAIPNAQM